MITKPRVLWPSLIAIVAVVLSSFGAIAAEEIHTVIVVGAGISGISAANQLSQAGIENILILEATNRIGGRIQKTNFAGLSVEIGANWVEGVGGPKLNPIWDLVNRLNLTTFYSNYDNVSSNAYKQTGGLYEISEAQTAFYAAQKLFEFITNVSEYLKDHRQDDISILASQRLNNQVPSTPLDMAIDYYAYDYEFAEPSRVTSLQNSIPLPTLSVFGEDIFFVADPKGYESVVQLVAKQFLATNESGEISDHRLLLNKVVNEISYWMNGVSVKTEDGCVYRADYVLVSASVGVLQSGLIKFKPGLPQWKILAMNQFDMAVYTKIFLKFPDKFWPTGEGTEFFLFAHEKRGYYTIWQQLKEEYPGANILLATVTDDESRRIEQKHDSDIKAEIMGVLRAMFGKNISEATDILVTRWWSDRFYRGSYSNWPVGFSRLDHDRIRATVERIYFTGEHTSRYFNGYVHGAYLAGIDSAEKLIRCIEHGDCYHSIPQQSDLDTESCES